MKKLALTIITIISLCSTNFSYGADRYVTLKTNAANSFTDSVNIAANQVATIVYAYSCFNQELKVTIGGDVFGLPGTSSGANRYVWWAQNKPVYTIVGPATITYDTGATASFATIKIQPNPNINGVGQ
mgnify:FL=1